jgi:hypothetical protein
MKSSLLAVALAGIWAGSAAAQAPNTLTPQEAKEGWKLLFDGKTLNGWTNQQRGAEWKAQDGAILMQSDAGGGLFTTETFDNFVLKVDFRTTPDVNSGVYIRYTPRTRPPEGQAKGEGKKKGKGGGMPGYEINIRDSEVRPVKDSQGHYDTGSVMGKIRAEDVEIVAGKWHHFEITALGDHITVSFDGKKIADGHDSDLKSGSVGLQWAHGELVTGRKIEFRNIKIKPLPAT